MKRVYGRAGVRYVITKFSQVDSLPNFLSDLKALMLGLKRCCSPENKLYVLHWTHFTWLEKQDYIQALVSHKAGLLAAF